MLMSILFLGGYLHPFESALNLSGELNNSLLEGLFYGVSLGIKSCVLVFTFI
jgi:NADH:ubiquinone oxidoreductase subunit H